MKKILSIFAFAFLGMLLAKDVQAIECPSISVYEKIKTNKSSAVYIVTGENELAAYPTEKVYKNWHEDFSGIKNVPYSCVEDYAVTNYVMPRPGVFVQKSAPNGQVYPSVYMVFPGNIVKKIRDVADAKYFGGTDWEKRIIAIPEVYFSFLEQQGEATDFAFGSIVKDITDASKYYVLDEGYIWVPLDASDYIKAKAPMVTLKKVIQGNQGTMTVTIHNIATDRTFKYSELEFNPAQVALRKQRNIGSIKNCGLTSDWTCMIEAAENCENATMEYIQPNLLGELLGIDIEAKSLYEFYKREDGKCVLYTKYTEYNLQYRENAREQLKEQGETEESIAGLQEKYKEDFEGASSVCMTNDTSQFVALLNRWKEGKFSSMDYSELNCYGFAKGDNIIE